MVYRLIGERYFTAVYENMEVVELWFSRFGRNRILIETGENQRKE